MSLKKSFVESFDQFCAPATLRTKGGSELSSVCTGVFSLLLWLFFTYVFVRKFYDVLTFESIEFKDLIDDKLSVEKKGEVMFAVRVSEVSDNLLYSPYFHFSATIQALNSSTYFYE